jgi:hypothetical protein
MGDAHGVGHLADRKSVEVVEHQREALTHRQRPDRADQVRQTRFVGLDRAGGGGTEPLDRLGSATEAAVLVEDPTDGHPSHPTDRVVQAGHGPPPQVRLDEGLLHSGFGVVGPRAERADESGIVPSLQRARWSSRGPRWDTPQHSRRLGRQDGGSVTGMPGVDQLTDVMERVLADPVQIRDVEPIGVWAVARVHLDGAEGLPPTVIVKWLRQNEAGFRTNPAQLARERDALGYLAKFGLDLAPRLLGCDEDLGLLVTEDLTPAVVLWDILGTDEHRGHEGLVAFASALGQLHAATAGRADEFYELVGRSAPVDPERDRRRIAGDWWDWDLPDLGAVGIDAMTGTHADMESVRDVLLEPGPFMAMSNGDAGANNVMIDDTGIRIIDWEMAGFRHALIDASCLFVPGPVWMTIAEPGPEVEHAYRQALAAGVDAAADDAYSLALAAACLASAIERAQRIPRLDRRPPGHHSRTQMIATLEAAAREASRRNVLGELAGWVSSAATTLRVRWPDADVELPNAYTRRE